MNEKPPTSWADVIGILGTIALIGAFIVAVLWITVG